MFAPGQEEEEEEEEEEEQQQQSEIKDLEFHSRSKITNNTFNVTVLIIENESICVC